MSIGQQIYFAIELFAPSAPQREHFCAQLARVLSDYGSAPAVAREISVVLAEALSEPCIDYHLAMAHLITFHPPLIAAMGGDVPAAHAMHHYMAYFLDLTDVRHSTEARYAIN